MIGTADTRSVGVLDLPTPTVVAQWLLLDACIGNQNTTADSHAPDVRASTSSLLRYQSFRYLASFWVDEREQRQVAEPAPSFTKRLRSANIGWIIASQRSRSSNKVYFLISKEPEKDRRGSAVRWKLITIPNVQSWKKDAPLLNNRCATKFFWNNYLGSLIIPLNDVIKTSASGGSHLLPKEDQQKQTRLLSEHALYPNIES